MLRWRWHLFTWNKDQLVQLILSMKAIRSFNWALITAARFRCHVEPDPDQRELAALRKTPWCAQQVKHLFTKADLGSSSSLPPKWWTPSPVLRDPWTNLNSEWIWVIIWLNRQDWWVGGAWVCVAGCPEWSWIQWPMCYQDPGDVLTVIWFQYATWLLKCLHW